jgi:hypothetical protein
MDTDFYFRVLYPLQDRVLAAVRDQETRLYLAGGTAAPRGYLAPVATRVYDRRSGRLSRSSHSA